MHLPTKNTNRYLKVYTTNNMYMTIFRISDFLLTTSEVIERLEFPNSVI